MFFIPEATARMDLGVTTNLSALFLSPKRLLEIVDQRGLSAVLSVASLAEIPTDQLRRVGAIVALEEALLAWLAHSSPLTLGQLVVEQKLEDGAFFTHLGPFYGKSIEDACFRISKGKPIRRPPHIHTALDSLSPGATLYVPVYPDNLTGMSAADQLTGRRRLFLLGRLTKATLPALEAQAYAIGHIHQEARRSGGIPDRFGLLDRQMEVSIRSLDPFAGAAELEAPSQSELRVLSHISEEDVKRAFAEIIGEPYVPKDWGGERSDLFSARLLLRGEAVTTAFAFKGPAKFKPLTVADLGKNGDQISRLFSEPADLVILQHCHQITTAVRDHMRAFATRIGQLRPFCLIDGADTVRILKFSGKFRELGG